MKKRYIFLTLISLITSSLSFAVKEESLKEEFSTKIKSFYSTGISKFYPSVEGKSAHYRIFKRGFRNVLLVLPGRTEPSTKYSEVIYDLRELPYDFILIDPIGQGLSNRLLEDKQKGYIEKYKNYREDLHTIFQSEIENIYDNAAILAHSMGGAISIHFAESYPHLIKGMVLSSPMMELKTNNLPEGVTLWTMGALRTLGKKKDYIPGGGRFESPIPFSENRVTQSKERYWMARTIDEESPDFYMGSATVNWVFQSIKMSRKIYKEREKLHGMPILMFQAGKDEFSKPKRQKLFCSTNPTCEFIYIPMAKHEMFQETDSIRDIVMTKANIFLKSLVTKEKD